MAPASGTDMAAEKARIVIGPVCGVTVNELSGLMAKFTWLPNPVMVSGELKLPRTSIVPQESSRSSKDSPYVKT